MRLVSSSGSVEVLSARIKLLCGEGAALPGAGGRSPRAADIGAT